MPVKMQHFAVNVTQAGYFIPSEGSICGGALASTTGCVGGPAAFLLLTPATLAAGALPEAWNSACTEGLV